MHLLCCCIEIGLIIYNIYLFHRNRENLDLSWILLESNTSNWSDPIFNKQCSVGNSMSSIESMHCRNGKCTSIHRLDWT